jgi:hypothetical protein
MKKLTYSAFWMLTLSFIALFSCNDPSEIGSDLLSGDQLDTEYVDTLTLKAHTVANDSFVVWGPGVNGTVFQNFAFGDYQDPVFGRTVASIFAQVVSDGSAPKFKSGTSVLDSIVLTLAYNTSLDYGKVDEPFTMEVYQMDQSLDVDEQYINTDSFSVKPTPLGTKTFTPNLKDSLTVLEPSGDTLKSVKVAPQLRIRLDDQLGNTFLGMDSVDVITDTTFLAAFKGIWLKPASQNAGLLSFIMRSANTNLKLYYSDGSAKKSYTFKIFSDNPVVLHQQNYYGGSEVAAHLVAPGSSVSDSILFLQGLNGTNIEFEIPYIESLQGVIINKAELILPILNDDTGDYAPVSQIYAVEIVSDTSAVVLDDIYYPSTRYPSSDFGDFFGGKARTDNTYSLNLASQLQRMIAGTSSNRIRLTVYARSERAARVVLGGPGHSAAPALLKIRYTKY